MDELRITEIAGDAPELVDVLAAAGLPVDDLREAGRRFFRFGDNGGDLIGFIGWEEAGHAALLRSLVVVPSRRGQGWSRVLIGWALRRLAEAGVTDAYLLTTSIETLAAKLGFARLDRALAPAAIRDSRQFAALCPATAIFMHRSLP